MNTFENYWIVAWRIKKNYKRGYVWFMIYFGYGINQ